MSNDYNEYIVDEVSGKSPSPGDPDRIANMVLERWGFIPKGENSAEKLFLSAVPPSRFAGCYRLKVLSQGDRLQAYLFQHDGGVEGNRIEFGPVLQNESELGNGHKIFVIEGQYLARIVVHCRPVLEASVPDENPSVPVVVPDSQTVPEVPVSTEPDKTSQPQANAALSKAELADISVSRIRRNKEQPRKKFNANDLLLLGMSMKDSGQTDRIEVIHVYGDLDADYELVKGERRWRAASLVGIAVLHAIVLTRAQIPNKDIQHGVCLISDAHHSKYSDLEIAFALAREKLSGNKTLQQLATMCKKKSLAWVSQHLAITSLHPELMKLLNPDLPRKDQMSFSIAWRIARLAPMDQLRVYGVVSKIKGAKLQIIETDRLVAKARPGEGKKKDPADQYRNLGYIIPRMLADVSIADEYAGEVFLSLIQHRPEDEIQLLLDRIEEIAIHLKGVKTKILGARQKWSECLQL
jgi:ParB/RepB/Spo0J family partition protein